MRNELKPWIEAMRLRTLPVSTAGVLAAWGVAIAYDCFLWLPGVICLIFAIGAQIASNFANEYFDFRNGLDRKGREGFRRGVTEGDIKPSSMLRATLLTLGITCLIGLSLCLWGGWWLIGAGVIIALFALAYSTGPWPLSHHGLGELAVIIFFGVVPVMLTLYVMNPEMDAHLNNGNSLELWRGSLAIGLASGFMAACVLIVNNVRDEEDDRAVGKNTTAVIFGPDTMKHAYLILAVGGVFLLSQFIGSSCGSLWGWLTIIPGGLWVRPYLLLLTRHGGALNPVLGLTARTMLFNISYLIIAVLFGS